MLRTYAIGKRNISLTLFAMLCLCASTVQAQFACLSLGTGAGNPGVSTGDRNTALGEFSLASNTTGSDNTSVGAFACNANTNGDSNTAVGSFALVSNTTGDVNTALGSGTMPSNTTGSASTAVGVNALNLNTTGGSNTAVGFQALFSNTSGNNNTAVGAGALGLGAGSGNIGLGFFAGRNVTNGSNNIHIGHSAPGNESNTIRIGNTQTATFLAGVDGVTIPSGTGGPAQAFGGVACWLPLQAARSALSAARQDIQPDAGMLRRALSTAPAGRDTPCWNRSSQKRTLL